MGPLVFPATKSISIPNVNFVLIIFFRFLIYLPPIMFKNLKLFPINLITALKSDSKLNIGSS